VLFSLIYTISLLFFCPGTPFNLAAGFLYGMALGSFVALTGCISGATGAFILGRTIARDWVKSKMNNTKFKAVDWALNKNGIYIVFLTRLSPLFPFPLLNYAFGATEIKLLQYFVGTSLGVAPATLGYTYIGTLMRNLTQMWNAKEDTDNQQQIIWWSVGVTLTLVSIGLISFITQRAISRATREYNALNKENIIELNELDIIQSEEILNEKSDEIV